MRDKFLCNSQALSAFPILGAGRQGATTFAAASCCPFFSFGSPFLHTTAGTTQHTRSKFKQRVMRKCVAMSDRLMPLRVQPSRSETCWNVTKCHACHAKRSYATRGTSKSNHGDRHRHGHTALARPPADGCEHTRNVERTHPQPQTPRVKREPLLRIREKRTNPTCMTFGKGRQWCQLNFPKLIIFVFVKWAHLLAAAWLLFGEVKSHLV